MSLATKSRSRYKQANILDLDFVTLRMNDMGMIDVDNDSDIRYVVLDGRRQCRFRLGIHTNQQSWAQLVTI
jgi:hypothetical protein